MHGMRLLLKTCNEDASDFDVVFIAIASKCLVNMHR